MALNASNIRAAVSGAVMTAPRGTTAPTDATSAWPAGWLDAGYVSDDGVEEEPNEDTQEIKAWQNAAVVRRVISKSEIRWKFTMIETKKTTLALYHRGNTPAGALPYRLDVKAAGPDPRMLGLDILDGVLHYRIIVPLAELSDRSAIKYASDEEIGYEVTLSGYPDANALVAIKYSDDAAWAAV